MRILPIFISTLLILSGSTQVKAQTTPDETAALLSDTQWLHLIDAGDYPGAWKSAAKIMQDGAPEPDLAKAIRNARTPLGAFSTRNVKQVHTTKSMPGAPDGLYVVAEYSTQFTNKPDGIETVVASKERDGTWRVSGYFVR